MLRSFHLLTMTEGEASLFSVINLSTTPTGLYIALVAFGVNIQFNKLISLLVPLGIIFYNYIREVTIFYSYKMYPRISIIIFNTIMDIRIFKVVQIYSWITIFIRDGIRQYYAGLNIYSNALFSIIQTIQVIINIITQNPITLIPAPIVKIINSIVPTINVSIGNILISSCCIRTRIQTVFPIIMCMNVLKWRVVNLKISIPRTPAFFIPISSNAI